MFSFYLFRRYFLSSRSTSLIKVVAWICLLGLAISVAALILITSIMGGFGQAINSRLISNEPHIVMDLKEDPFKNKFSQKLMLKKQDGIQDIIFFETQDLILKTPSGFQAVLATGYSEKYLNYQISKELNQEDMSKEGEESHSKRSYVNQGKWIYLNYDLLTQLDLNIGDEITVMSLKSLLLPPSMMPPLKKVIVKDILPDTFQKGFALFYRKGDLDFGQYSQLRYGAEVRLHDPENYLFYQEFFKDFKTTSWVDRNSTLFFALKLEKFIMTLFIILAIIISCLGISSSLFLLMTQKGKDIGIFHSIGLSRKDIVKIFTRLGFYLALIGITLGFCIGFFGSLFFKYNKWNILPAMYEDRTIPAVLDPFQYFLIILASILLAALACYFPTRYLTQIKPVELLKITGR
ncbi:MAG: ABC transporter permease [Bdellovibrionales bacterium]